MLISIAKDLMNGRTLSAIILAEAGRLKAAELGYIAEYNAMHGGEMAMLRIRSFTLPKIEFSSEREFMDFVKGTANNGGAFFNDYRHLADAVKGYLSDFGSL